MAAGWSAEPTAALLAIWGDENVQKQLDGVARNRSIYEKISSKLKEKSFNYNWKQCRTKVKNLTQRYRKIKDGHTVSGTDRKSCPYYEQIDKILGCEPYDEEAENDDPELSAATGESSCEPLSETTAVLEETSASSSGMNSHPAITRKRRNDSGKIDKFMKLEEKRLELEERREQQIFAMFSDIIRLMQRNSYNFPPYDPNMDYNLQ
ncbi:PREDICTED: zinc finger and SCAN domain-containing protein 29-like [Amphimedon queenslandica]|uniref:Myb/SANT-like DNA-binding domain-containing protein n=1 Tax=Amphimedon queenslandica TaxID=400682 RepID=A0AAN0IQ96_AMPQE|nr:PREDICTED: zinc finger and SCAN domain-containing protein 29-like [Amphimedon queenslandica]|eukprot:XP_011406090.1 PREDICTED: zinc finger and SCAN domain-containing protein 29-like [Amphimedon queenslandica]